MPRDYASLPMNAVRRQDRAVDDESWIRAFLHRAPVGVLATVHEGQPFINSNLFVYLEEVQGIYLHTAKVGRTRANIERDGACCFSVFEMGRLLPAEAALEFSVEYAGVTVFGTVSLVQKAEEARRGLQALLDKYAPHLHPGTDYHAITSDELKRTSVFRLDIASWSGKQKQAAEDFPGAYRYADILERVVGGDASFTT